MKEGINEGREGKEEKGRSEEGRKDKAAGGSLKVFHPINEFACGSCGRVTKGGKEGGERRDRRRRERGREIERGRERRKV